MFASAESSCSDHSKVCLQLLWVERYLAPEKGDIKIQYDRIK